MTTKHIDPDRAYGEHEHALLDWVRAHGVDPNDIPVPSDVHIGPTKVTFERWLRDADGQIMLDGDWPMTETVTVPLVAPWPLEQQA